MQVLDSLSQIFIKPEVVQTIFNQLLTLFDSRSGQQCHLIKFTWPSVLSAAPYTSCVMTDKQVAKNQIGGKGRSPKDQMETDGKL